MSAVFSFTADRPVAGANDARTDGALDSARNAGASNDPKRLEEAARQLEGVFLGMVFNEMAKTVDDAGGLFPETPGRELYEEWFRTEIARQWADAGGTGLGDTIASALGDRSEAGKARSRLAGDGGASSVSALPLVGSGAMGSGVASFATASATPVAISSTSGAATSLSVSSLAAPPVDGFVTSPFGPRIHPVTGESAIHEGVDLAVPVGTPVRSPFPGTVESVGRDPHGGLMVVVRHAAGYRSTYAHNSEVLVRAGEPVAAGQVLSRSGDSGRTTGPHLHFELTRDGKPVDPSRWLKFRLR